MHVSWQDQRSADRAPAVLARPFRIIAFDWDGTAVANRKEDASEVREDLEELLRLGVYIVVITGTNFGNVDRQFSSGIHGPHKRRLFVMTDRGSEVHGFNEQSQPVLLWRRRATEAEDRMLTEIADRVKGILQAKTGLAIEIVYKRLNRRKIDLIPVPEWNDPPKSALGELFLAVESRLRSAGLAGGLHEAIALTEKVSHEKGLRDARITSDVKHIEVGLTDKADAIDWLVRELADRKHIPVEDVLLAGDEFGAPGGIEGSDHKMMIDAIRGATVISVGPEPAGVPEGVLFLGGGPSRFRKFLEEQIAVYRELADRTYAPSAVGESWELPARPTADPAWLLVEEGFQPAREHEVESVLAIGNGYVGVRGSLAERSPLSAPATFVAGVFGVPPHPGAIPELVKTPDWTHWQIAMDGREFNLADEGTLAHRRVLDMRQGMLWREWHHRDSAGRVTRLVFLRLASLADRHLLLQAVAASAENYSGQVSIRSEFPGAHGATAVTLSQHKSDAGLKALTSDALLMKFSAPGKGTTVALAAASRFRDGEKIELQEETIAQAARRHWTLTAELGRTYCVDRFISLYTSRDVAQPADAALGHLSRILANGGSQAAVAAHRRAWEERWQTADVEVEGDPQAQIALRFALFHLIATANPEDEGVSIGARALTGEGYKGHVFWDTEIYMLPFYIFTHPATARALLMYRFHTLGGAHEKARSQGYRGAMYAWESADDGRETTPSTVLGPGGQLVRVLSGEQEHHITADVAYAVWQYWMATGDDEFFLQAGAEILLDTARFWASRGMFEADGLYHIHRIIGPDEYHETVDDNAFTNVMAQWNLQAALAAVRTLRQRWPGRAGEILDRLQVTPEELDDWKTRAERMYTGFDATTALFEQFRGYFDLDDIDLAAYEPRTAPMDVLLGRERTQQSQVVKQADVVMLLALLWDRFPPEVRKANFRYYEPRTGHGSSLSPSMHALVAARLGDGATAFRYFRQAALIDLANNMGNAAGGVHAAALGGLWQAVVLGFAGMTLEPEGLRFAPRLPDEWQSLRFPVQWCGRQLHITMRREPRSIKVQSSGHEAVRIALDDGPELNAMPGRAYAIECGHSGWRTWRETDTDP